MASATDKNTNPRFLDVSEEPNRVLLPIRGYANEPLLPLEDAVQPIYELLNDLDMMVDAAKLNSKKPADSLNTNESAAIHLYTIQWEEPDVSLYTMLNSTLRSERRESLKPWFHYLKLILTALYKLPSLKSVVWRGVRGNVSDQYDDAHIWWGFSSCTESVEVMEQFIGKSGVRTLFTIECINGKSIRAHSFYKKENEILLLPGSYFRVVGKWSPAKDLYIVHLRETPAPHPYLEPPFQSTASIGPTSTTASPSSFKTSATDDAVISQVKDVPASSATYTTPNEDQQFATPGNYKRLPCHGRPCAACGKCRDWYYTGDLKTWNWIRNYKNWNKSDRDRWRNDKVYIDFKHRNGKTCYYDYYYDYYYNFDDYSDYYYPYHCLCENNVRN